MKSCARLFGFIFVFLFVVSAPLALILYNVDSYLLTADPYIQSLDEAALRDRLPAMIADQIQHSLVYNPCIEDPGNCDENAPTDPGGGPPEYLRALDEDQWQLLFNGLFDPIWMQDQVENVLKDIFHNLEPGVTPVPIRISLSEIKTRLAGEPGLTLAKEMLAAQPPCTAEQVLTLLGNVEPVTNVNDLLACNPPSDLLAGFEPEMSQALAKAAEGLPDTLQLEMLDAIMQLNRGAEAGQGGPDLASVRRLMKLSPVIPLAFMLLIILFTVRSFYDFARWVGFPLFIVGLIMAVGTFLAPGMLNWALDRFVIPIVPGMLSASTSEFMLEFLRSVGRSTAQRIALQSALILLVGGVLLLASSLTRRRRSVDSIPPLTKPRGDGNGGA